MNKEYNAAVGESIPVLLVDNMQDFALGMKDMQENGISATTYSINSHGSEGYAKIGMQATTLSDDFTPLRDGLSGKNVFFGSCAMTRGADKFGKEYIKNFAEQTNATVVSSDHSILTGFRFNGTDYLSKPHGELTEKRKSYRSYHVAIPRDTPSGVVLPMQIYDFTIDKTGKFIWKETFDDEVKPK